MRLVVFASTISFGLVAGLSQANDWGQPRTAGQLVRFDPATPLQARSLDVDWQGEPGGKVAIGPALGDTIRDRETLHISNRSQPHAGYGLSLPVTGQFSTNAKSWRPESLHNTRPQNDPGTFIVRAAFRF